MIILTENNVIKNIMKTLNKKCDSENQIDDFLQFCIQLLFFDTIHVSGTAPISVTNATKELIDILQKEHSISNISIQEHANKSKKYNSLLNDLSDALCLKLDDFYNDFFNIKQNAMNYFGINTPYIEETTNIITKAIQEKEKKYLHDDNMYDSFTGEILRHDNHKVFDKLSNITNAKIWDSDMTLCLRVEIRIMTYRILSRLNKQIYSPSVLRSRIDKNRIIKPNVIESIIPEWGKLHVEVPLSLRDYLIDKGKGNPEDILKIALELREHFKRVRKYISENENNTIIVDQILAINEIKKAVLSNKKKKNMQLIIENAYTHGMGIEPISVSTPVFNFENIEKEKELNICVQVFTEVIEDIIRGNNRKSIYHKSLMEKCINEPPLSKLRGFENHPRILSSRVRMR